MRRLTKQIEPLRSTNIHIFYNRTRVSVAVWPGCSKLARDKLVAVQFLETVDSEQSWRSRCAL